MSLSMWLSLVSASYACSVVLFPSIGKTFSVLFCPRPIHNTAFLPFSAGIYIRKRGPTAQDSQSFSFFSALVRHSTAGRWCLSLYLACSVDHQSGLSSSPGHRSYFWREPFYFWSFPRLLACYIYLLPPITSVHCAPWNASSCMGSSLLPLFSILSLRLFCLEMGGPKAHFAIWFSIHL
ncbi:hypothetical protein HYPSUDRAFT_561306 [Hypholoma sublateritium FD-334 SS-4]|uniref:Secreted protein n=1 Tax=Hypholoma sublateritium (strain FD-334 SS-4) TaxID=945553 RepID=A0A0D2P5D0_HYPSF|nr:hypothetical protein HYPSUDRAFT_561306 [Hypholoma sublateritium FD-334 SS-4]